MQPLCPSFVCLFFSSDMVSIFIVYLSILSALFVNYFTPMRVCPCFMMFGSWLSELFFQHVLTKVILLQISWRELLGRSRIRVFFEGRIRIRYFLEGRIQVNPTWIRNPCYIQISCVFLVKSTMLSQDIIFFRLTVPFLDVFTEKCQNDETFSRKDFFIQSSNLKSWKSSEIATLYGLTNGIGAGFWLHHTPWGRENG